MLTILGTLERPTSGEVKVAGRDVAKASDRELAGLRAHQIGFVFQTFHLQDTMTAVENVANGMLYTGRPQPRAARGRGGRTRAGRPRPPAHPPAAAALGRRAPARRDRARARQAAADHPRRRADREPRLEIRRGGRGPAARARIRRRHARADHPRSQHRRVISPTDPDARRRDRGGRALMSTAAAASPGTGPLRRGAAVPTRAAGRRPPGSADPAAAGSAVGARDRDRHRGDGRGRRRLRLEPGEPAGNDRQARHQPADGQPRPELRRATTRSCPLPRWR